MTGTILSSKSVWIYLNVLILLASLFSAQAAEPTSPLIIELNKTEDVENACRAYMTFQNKSDSVFTALKLDLVIFGRDGVITKRLALEGAPLPAGKTRVKLFDLQGTACSDLDRVLLNDVLACRDAAAERQDCSDLITPLSRAKISFAK